MLRLSKLADYAIVVLSYLAKDHAKVHAAIEISEETGIALPTVSKVLKFLLKARVLRSVRGAKGGYSLAIPPEKITIATVITALEGPISLTECSLTDQGCEKASGCDIRGNWSLINKVVANALESITLADLIVPPPENANEIMIPIADIGR